MDTTKEISVG